MNAIAWVVVFVFDLGSAIGILCWHFTVDASLGEMAILHALNILMGVFGIFDAIDSGRRFGWRK